ncbi:MAG: sulfatase-like hydrolase/transferase [Candidatus Limnocylindria bacterium]
MAVQGVANGSLPALIGDLTDTPPERSAARVGELPDIYLILLDGYPRADTVRDVLDSDNSEFLAALESRGFTVDPAAHSGYMYTDLAVSSMLHGRHLVDIPQLADVINGAQLPARGRQVLNEAPLLAALAESGYTLMANAQAWDEPALRRVHCLVEGHGTNEFERHFFLQSLPGAIWYAVDPGIRQDLMEPWVHDAFAFVELAASADVDGPRFAFVHVPSPHFPIVFIADGGRADSRFNADHPGQVRASMEENKEACLGQLDYVNDRLLEALDGSAIAEGAMDVVMSDHGPEFGLDWTMGANTDLETRFATMFAIRGPGEVYEQGQAVTGVLIRLLNWLDVTSLPEPEDRFFVSDQWPKYRTLMETDNPWPAQTAATDRPLR